MLRTRREAPAAPPDPSAVETLIGKGAQLQGDLKSAATVRLDGHLEGTLQTSGDLIVGESGQATATVEASSVLVAGEVRGHVKATTRLEIAATGRIIGDVETPILVVNEGGRLDGKCTMGVTSPPEVSATASPTGMPSQRTAADATPRHPIVSDGPER